MDITSIFKASVKTARLRNSSLPAPDKNRILHTSKQRKSEFTLKTLDIRHQISQLRNLLLENRAAYMRFGQHLKSARQMSDAERDIIDSESENILTICTQFIGDLRSDASGIKSAANKQDRQHREAVLELLAEYLRAVCRIYQQQKEYRVRHELDTYRLLKLESNKKLIPVLPGRDRTALALPDASDADEEDSENHSLYSNSSRKSNGALDPAGANSDDDDNESFENSTDERKLARRHPDTTTQSLPSSTGRGAASTAYRSFDDDYGNAPAQRFELDATAISADDIQMFESENHQLYQEFKGLSDEVEQIERNVTDIAKLQDIFTEKVGVHQDHLFQF